MRRKTRSNTIPRRELLKRGAIASGVAATGLATFSGTSLAGCTVDHKCARTPGYWKNHPDMWHGDHLHLGTADDSTDRYNYFSSFGGRPSALEILQTEPEGDKSIIMAIHLIATLLNVKAGTDPSCITGTVADARAWLDSHPVGSGVESWDGGESIKDTLDAYNNGQLCACKAD